MCLFIAISMFGTSLTGCSSNSKKTRRKSRTRSKADVELSSLVFLHNLLCLLCKYSTFSHITADMFPKNNFR